MRRARPDRRGGPRRIYGRGLRGWSSGDDGATIKEDKITQSAEESAEDLEEIKAKKYFQVDTDGNFLDKDHGAQRSRRLVAGVAVVMVRINSGESIQRIK